MKHYFSLLKNESITVIIGNVIGLIIGASIVGLAIGASIVGLAIGAIIGAYIGAFIGKCIEKKGIGFIRENIEAVIIEEDLKDLKKLSIKKEERERENFYHLVLVGKSKRWKFGGESLVVIQRTLELTDSMTMETIPDLESDSEIKQLVREYYGKFSEAQQDLDRFQAYQSKNENKLKELLKIKANCEYLMKVSHGEGLRQEYEKVCEHQNYALNARQEILKIIEAQERRLRQIIDHIRNHIINKKTLGRVMELSLSNPEDDGVLAHAQAIMELIDKEWAFDQKLQASI